MNCALCGIVIKPGEEETLSCYETSPADSNQTDFQHLFSKTFCSRACSDAYQESYTDAN